jgi:hypothetical protein
MKINTYYMSAASERTYRSLDAVGVSIKRSGPPLAQTALNGVQTALAGLQTESPPKAALFSISDNARRAMADAQPHRGRTARASGAVGDATSGTRPYDEMLSLLEAMLEKLTGKKFTASARTAVRLTADTGVTFGQGGQPFEAKQQITAVHYESETVSYSAQGFVNTADGRTISVDLNFNMSREVFSAVSETINLNAQDPLVVNYNGSAASLTSRKFDFDLNFDGVMDQISFAGEGSGFLALDKNGDGAINNGSELFGPRTGSGFSELRNYDIDRNGWIDENDDIFTKLLIWSKDSDGKDLLITLKEADVGAIYLGDISTQYTLDGGAMRSTSVFLKESGGAGTVHHIDLNV